MPVWTIHKVFFFFCELWVSQWGRATLLSSSKFVTHLETIYKNNSGKEQRQKMDDDDDNDDQQVFKDTWTAFTVDKYILFSSNIIHHHRCHQRWKQSLMSHSRGFVLHTSVLVNTFILFFKSWGGCVWMCKSIYEDIMLWMTPGC